MNSPSEKVPFDPRLKLLAQSLVEFRTGFSENDYLGVVDEIARHLNLSNKSNCLLLAEKDGSYYLLKYLLENYQKEASVLSKKVDIFFTKKWDEIVYYLIDILISDERNENLLQVAFSAFENLIPADDRVLTSLLSALNDENPKIRATAKLAFKKLRTCDEYIIATLLGALKDDDPRIRAAAKSALEEVKFGSEHSIKSLLMAMKGEDSFVSDAVKSALEKSEPVDRNAYIVLLAATNEIDPNIRGAVALALGNLQQFAVQARLEFAMALHYVWFLIFEWDSSTIFFPKRVLDDLSLKLLINLLKEQWYRSGFEVAIKFSDQFITLIQYASVTLHKMHSSEKESYVKKSTEIALRKLELIHNEELYHLLDDVCLSSVYSSINNFYSFIKSSFLSFFLTGIEKRFFLDIRSILLSAVGANNESVITTLLVAMKDEFPVLRVAAIMTLGNLEQIDQRVISSLCLALRDDDANIRRAAALALGNLGRSDDDVIFGLIHSLKDNSIDVKAAAIKALRNIRIANGHIISMLIDSAKGGVFWDRDAAATALESLRPDDENGVDFLLSASKDNNVNVRRAAILALGNLNQAYPRVVKSLLNALNDSKGEVIAAAASALGSLEKTDEQVIVALYTTLQNDNNENINSVATALVKALLGHKYAINELEKIVPKSTKKSLLNGQNHSVNFKKEKIISSILEAVSLQSWQAIFETPNAVRTIIKAFMREEAADSIYYALPFFNIRRLKLPIALELLQELANPMTDERTKLVIFQLLLRVELVDEQGQPLRQEKR